MSMFSFTPPIQGVGQVSVGIKGGTAWLRPLGPDEAEPLHAVFDAMSLESRYDRYLQGVSTLTPALTRTLTAVDGTDHVAWLASIGDRPAGMARYLKVDACTAEIAFEVADEFHGRGLGAVLVDTVTTIAAASGVRKLQAMVLGSNHRSRRLLSQVGLELAWQDGGVLEADGPFQLLDRPRIDRSKVVQLALAAQPLAA
jgi:RimJ/RimL family protein N-acetyltransferase